MKVSIRFAGNVSCLTDNTRKVDYELKSLSSVGNVIHMVDHQFPGFRNSICTDTGDVADHVNIYVNGDNIRYLDGLDTELKDGDAVHVIPAAAAG